MPGLNVLAKISAKNGSEQAVHDALVELAEASRADAGCRSYLLYVSESDPTAFFTVEEWDGAESLDAHMVAPHVAESLRVVGPHLASDPDIHRLRPIG